MVVKTSRIPSISEMIKRRYHADVRKLKKQCEELEITLFDFYSANDSCVCILSSDEYEIGCNHADCSAENENYFVSEDDYTVYCANK